LFAAVYSMKVVDWLHVYSALREIIDTLMSVLRPSYGDVNRIKMYIAAKYQLDKVPSNSELIDLLGDKERDKLLPILKRKVTRMISGVTVVAVMTKPYSCPQPDPCAYCPGGPSVGAPQSYTGYEPAAMRGIQNSFNPYLQVTNRIRQLQAIGHCVDKVELIIMGGTFSATPLRYQRWFVKRCLDATTDKKSANLAEAKKNAETSERHNVGITVETRPDWAQEKHVNRMLDMGVTRVEIGVQNPDNAIYRLVGRKHTVRDVTEATRIMKDAGLKIVYHMMPGLPGSSPQKDFEAFKRIFSDPLFKPDMIKIYPCLVLKSAKIYRAYAKGKYKPYSTEEAADLTVEIKKFVPSWVRIMRIQRDIPAPLIVAGVKHSNLRQLVRRKLEAQNTRCRCIRCREVGHRMQTTNLGPDPDKVKILTISYSASEGTELFISAEEPKTDALIGYLRLRIPSEKATRPEIKASFCSVVRELHVYGSLVPVGMHVERAWQHKGYGEALLAEAERLTLERYNLKKILVISALGTKQYYRRLGYDYDGVYMSKPLEN
jgi:elongator complex protein 3